MHDSPTQQPENAHWQDPLIVEFHSARTKLYDCLIEKLDGDMELIEQFVDRLHYLWELIGVTTDDWLAIKQRLVISLSAKLRRKRLFTKRRTDRKFYYNELELAIIDYWKSFTGVRPTIRPEHYCEPGAPKKKQYQSIRDHNARASAALLERNRKKLGVVAAKPPQKNK